MKVTQKEAVALGLSGEMMKLSEVKPNPDNPRVMKDEKFEKLCKSLDEFPKMMALRPMVVDADGVVLGGNMRLRALQHLGYTSVPVEWVKNASDLTEDEQRRFIIEDNVSFGEWDYDALANEWADVPLNDWGMDVWDGEEGDGIVPENYVRKIELPTYTPSEIPPSVAELTDREKYDGLVQRIADAELPDDVREFLMVAATRHIRFNYALIGDYYASATPEVQRLMEDSALVIIDLGDAIAKGFVKMTKQLAAICAEEKERRNEE